MKTALAAPIPEPVHRIAPRPITKGLSLRECDIPIVSFDQVRKVCKYYQDKGAGKYTPKSKASRYLYDVTEEVISMLDKLEQYTFIKQKENDKKLQNNSKSLEEWSQHFGGEQGNLSPKDVSKKLDECKNQIKELEEQMKQEKSKNLSQEGDLYNMVEEHHRSARETLEQTKAHYNQQFEELNNHWKAKFEELKNSNNNLIEELKTKNRKLKHKIRTIESSSQSEKSLSSKQSSPLSDHDNFDQINIEVGVDNSPSENDDPRDVVIKNKMKQEIAHQRGALESSLKRTTVMKNSTLIKSNSNVLDAISNRLKMQEEQNLNLLRRAKDHAWVEM
ncbi:hypothetical protein AKO1_005235 [Acrasis kona]|uniref:Uncharacterized protein n=1 Tax=Acrasis kona TaxID=1008807 RepID=A0AAW2YKG4_9EUKA